MLNVAIGGIRKLQGYLFIEGVEFGGFAQIMSRNGVEWSGVEWSGNLKQGLREAECVFNLQRR